MFAWLSADALQNPGKCIGKEFVPAPDVISNSEVAAIITQVTGTTFSYSFMPDEQARNLPFPAAIAWANMFQFVRGQPAVEKRASLPALGQGPSVQEFVEQHKAEFLELFKNARQVG